MTDFSCALAREEMKLVIATNLPSMVDENSVFIGPTKVDLMAAYKPWGTINPPVEAPKEMELLSRWKADALAGFYRQQKANRYIG